MRTIIELTILGGGFESLKEFSLTLHSGSKYLASRWDKTLQGVCTEKGICYECGGKLRSSWEEQEKTHLLTCKYCNR
jgi:hypothetical protein